MGRQTWKLHLIDNLRRHKSQLRRLSSEVKFLLPATKSTSVVINPTDQTATGNRRKVWKVPGLLQPNRFCWLICYRICQHKLKTLILFLLLASITTIYVNFGVISEFVVSYSHGTYIKHCSIPDLNPLSPEVKEFVVTKPPPNCLSEQRSPFQDVPFILKNGNILVKNHNVDTRYFDGCCYRPFQRLTENAVKSAKFCKEIKDDETKIPEEHEYIEILCIEGREQTDFRDGFALVQTKDAVEKRVGRFDRYNNYKRNRLSVVILGLDSTSQMNFLRSMPKSHQYLSQNQSAILIKGYTKVGESTAQNVIPLLTGKSMEEFREECVDQLVDNQQVHLDHCTFIWKSFGENGYRTAFSEDEVRTGIFNMHWPNAFVQPPVDYYLRPFSIAMNRATENRNALCFGSTLSFEKLTENVRSLADVFEDQSYFHFTWSSKLSHDDFNQLQWGDEHLAKLLEHFGSSGYFNHTALLIVGDQGSFSKGIRATNEGKIEERMPIAYVVLPEWLQHKYPVAYRNLKKNADRITSPYDLHKTLHNFINLDSLEENNLSHDGKELFKFANDKTISWGQLRGTSLFHEFPDDRTCTSAGIPLHWCICRQKIPKDISSEWVRNASEAAVSVINVLLKEKEDCATLVLETVNEVYNVYTDDTVYNERKVLQIAFTVSPSSAEFKTTLVQKDSGDWELLGELARTNSYNGQSYCVEQKLKPYCYCIENDSE